MPGRLGCSQTHHQLEHANSVLQTHFAVCIEVSGQCLVGRERVGHAIGCAVDWQAHDHLQNRNGVLQAHGIGGLLGSAGLSFFGTASDAPPWTAVVQNQAQLVALHPAGGLFRALWLAPAGSTPPEGPELSAQAWRLSEVLAGVAVVSAPVVDAYVPQMLNFESVGGVNFKKGCYPGQEVVARSQFRGTLKRRGYIAKSTAILQAGQEIFTAQDPEQACGSVAMSALALPADAQHMGSYAIVSLQTSSNQDLLHAGSASGPQLTLMPLPYPLLEDI